MYINLLSVAFMHSKKTIVIKNNKTAKPVINGIYFPIFSKLEIC